MSTAVHCDICGRTSEGLVFSWMRIAAAIGDDPRREEVPLFDICAPCLGALEDGTSPPAGMAVIRKLAQHVRAHDDIPF